MYNFDDIICVSDEKGNRIDDIPFNSAPLSLPLDYYHLRHHDCRSHTHHPPLRFCLYTTFHHSTLQYLQVITGEDNSMQEQSSTYTVPINQKKHVRE